MTTAIVIPIYKPTLNPIEKKRLMVTFTSNSQVEKYFLYPSDLDLAAYEPFLSKAKLIPWESSCFLSRDHYNRLMLSRELYLELKNKMDNVLICQTDAFLIRNIHDLENFNFDYIGASWNPAYVVSHLGRRLVINRPLLSRLFPSTYLTAGNGGLSFRKVNSMIKIIEIMKRDFYWPSLVSLKERKMNEDLAFVLFGIKEEFRIADKFVADKIFIESSPFKVENLSTLYGFHALGRSNPELENSILKNLISS